MSWFPPSGLQRLYARFFEPKQKPSHRVELACSIVTFVASSALSVLAAAYAPIYLFITVPVMIISGGLVCQYLFPGSGSSSSGGWTRSSSSGSSSSSDWEYMSSPSSSTSSPSSSMSPVWIDTSSRNSRSSDASPRFPMNTSQDSPRVIPGVG